MIETRGRILVVDDEPLVLETIEAALKEEGYDVHSSSTSHHAIGQLDKNKFDAIVCDIKLDELSGFEVLNFAKKKQQNITSILITGAPNAGDRDRAKLLNA
ncbi:MAG: response regulator, partial [Proteobacteria bacterium]|nr:response regulator [Pseudomonadota bacterium]